MGANARSFRLDKTHTRASEPEKGGRGPTAQPADSGDGGPGRSDPERRARAWCPYDVDDRPRSNRQRSAAEGGDGAVDVGGLRRASQKRELRPAVRDDHLRADEYRPRAAESGV